MLRAAGIAQPLHPLEFVGRGGHHFGEGAKAAQQVFGDGLGVAAREGGEQHQFDQLVIPAARQVRTKESVHADACGGPGGPVFGLGPVDRYYRLEIFSVARRRPETCSKPQNPANRAQS